MHFSRCLVSERDSFGCCRVLGGPLFSQFLDLRGKLGNVKEKLTRKYLNHFNYKSLIKSIIRALEKDFRKSL